MKIVISGGGTAGHVNPALAVASELRDRGHEILYIGTPHGVESQLVPAAGFEYLALEAAGFDRARKSTLFTSSAQILKSARKAQRLFRKDPPDIVVGFGGYVALPVGIAARRMHIPEVIHEQNSVPGMTNRYLAKHGATVAVTYELSRKYFDVPDARFNVTGNPVRESVLEGDRAHGRALFDMPDDALMLLVFGGSLGARHLNEAIVSMKDDLLAIPDLYIVQSTGEGNYDEVCELLGDTIGPRWQIRRYIDEMGDTLAACDAIISRAGATSLAEICALGLPSILVPFPHATDDHQTKNAADLQEAGACIMIADRDLELEESRRRIVDFLCDGDLRGKMAERTAAFGKPDATMLLADLICEKAVAGRGSTSLS